MLSHITSKFNLTPLASLFPQHHTTTLLIEDEQEYGSSNLRFRSVDIYLSTIISPTSKRLRVLKDRDMKHHVYALDTNEELIDAYQNVRVKWRLILKHVEASEYKLEHYVRYYELTFETKHEQTVLNSYLPHIEERAKRMIQECKVTRLFEVNFGCGVSEYPFEFTHPIRFENLAVDWEVKCAVYEDLKRFKANGSKRGYLISGESGSGKSSLIAAMANELEYDIYDVDVAGVFERDSCEYLDSFIEFTPSKSMVLIEDLDTIFDSHQIQEEMMRVMEKAWSKCGDEKVIVVTTKKALAKGENSVIDFQIEMPNCNYSAFKQLAFNHFGITSHNLYEEIERIIPSLQLNLSQVVAELTKSPEVDVSLLGFVSFLQKQLS